MEPFDLPDGYSQPGEVFQVVQEILNDGEVIESTRLEAAKILFDEIRFQSQPKAYREGVEKLRGILFSDDD